MKTSITSIAKIAGGLTLLAASSVATASVSNTAHNLSGNVNGMHLVGSTEICIFCHTPHGANQSVDAPIWNRAVSSTSVYTRFSTLGRLTFDAKEAPIGSVSIACLSCHDGTQARDAVINSPGTGSTGFVVGTASGVWYDGTTLSTAYLSDLTASDNGVIGDMIYLGTDLRNDHPISMQYGGGGLNTLSPTGTTRDPDFSKAATTGTGGYGATAANNAGVGTTAGNPATTLGIATGLVIYSANYGSNGAGPKWYVDTGTAGYQGTDFPLYTRNDAGDGLTQPFVECATCHDPHSANSTFLRLPGGNVRSQVCLTCHAK